MKKHISVKLKMTLWLTALMMLLSALLVGFMVMLSQSVAQKTAIQQLKTTVKQNVPYITVSEGKPQIDAKFSYFHGGVSLLVYSQKETLLAGQVPVTYTASESFKNGEIRTVEVAAGKYIVMDVWIADGWTNGVWLRGVLESPDRLQLTQSLLMISMITLPLFVLLAALGGYRIAKRAFRPLDHINQTAERITEAKDLTGRIGLPDGKDEFSRLAANFDGMLERLERSFEAEKQFTSDASHELRTPVSIIKGACEFAEKFDETPEERQETIEMIHRQAERMSKLIQQLLSMTRMEQGTEKFNLTPVNIKEWVASLFEEEGWDRTRCHIEVDGNLVVALDPILAQRLLRNLVENAFKYGKPEGKVWIRACKIGEEFQLSVQDDGIGIAEEEQEKVWKRFYQSDASRGDESGAGLGLSMVQKIAEMHGGYMTLQSEVGKGSTFIFHLPM